MNQSTSINNKIAQNVDELNLEPPKKSKDFVTEFIDFLKKKHLLPQNIKPLHILSGLALLVLVTGAGAGYFLTQINQDVRQQASEGTYVTIPICTSVGSTECIDGVVYECMIPGSTYQETSETCGQSACEQQLGYDYENQVANCNAAATTEWNDTLCNCISNQPSCFTTDDECATFNLANCNSSNNYPNNTQCRAALNELQPDSCSQVEIDACTQVGGECEFDPNLGRGVCRNVSAGGECSNNSDCGGELICQDSRCVQPTGVGGQDDQDDDQEEEQQNAEDLTVNCFEYDARNRSCVSRGEFPTLAACENTFTVASDLNGCRSYMNQQVNLDQSGTGTEQSVRDAVYGTVACAGGAAPGTCDLTRGSVPQICGKWQGRPGYWVNATQFEIDSICNPGNQQPVTEEVVELVDEQPQSTAPIASVEIETGRPCYSGSSYFESGEQVCLTRKSYVVCNDGAFQQPAVQCLDGFTCQSGVGCPSAQDRRGVVTEEEETLPESQIVEVEEDVYGTVACAGGAAPGTCDFARGSQPQICGKWQGRPGYWINASEYEIESVCRVAQEEEEEEPVEVLVERDSDCYYGVSSCSNIGLVESNFCGASCPETSASCCGEEIDLSSRICSPFERSCEGNTSVICNASGEDFIRTSCSNGCFEGACLSDTCQPGTCTDEGLLCNSYGRVSAISCEEEQETIFAQVSNFFSNLFNNQDSQDQTPRDESQGLQQEEDEFECTVRFLFSWTGLVESCTVESEQEVEGEESQADSTDNQTRIINLAGVPGSYVVNQGSNDFVYNTNSGDQFNVPLINSSNRCSDGTYLNQLSPLSGTCYLRNTCDSWQESNYPASVCNTLLSVQRQNVNGESTTAFRSIGNIPVFATPIDGNQDGAARVQPDMIIIHTDANDRPNPQVSTTLNAIQGAQNGCQFACGFNELNEPTCVQTQDLSDGLTPVNHCATGRNAAINIEIAGMPDQVDPLLLEEVIQLVDQIRADFGIDNSQIYGHYEQSEFGKPDPGETVMQEIRNRL